MNILTGRSARACMKLVRYIVASIRVSPEVVEYPDVKTITARARTSSQTCERLWMIHDLEHDPDSSKA